MRETVHAKDNHDVQPTVWFDFVKELVFLDDFVGNVAESHADVFGSFQGCVEVEV